MSPNMPDDVELTAAESVAFAEWARDRLAVVAQIAVTTHMSPRDAAEALAAFEDSERYETLRAGVEQWVEDWGDDCGALALRRLRALLDPDA